MRINASRGHPSTITMSKQGKIAYAGYKDAIVLDVEERLSPIDVVINSTNVTCLAFSSDDQYLATGTSKGLKLYNLENRSVDKKDYFDYPVLGVHFSKDDKELVYCGTSSSDALQSIRMQGRSDMMVTQSPYGNYTAGLKISENNKIIAFDEKSKFMVGYEVKGAAIKQTQLRDFTETVLVYTFIGTSDIIASGYGQKAIKLMGFEGMDVSATLTDDKQSSCFGLSSSLLNENLLASVHGGEKSLRVWDIEKQTCIYKRKISDCDNPSIDYMPHSCNWYKNFILTTTLSGSMILFDARSAETTDSINMETIDKNNFPKRFIANCKLSPNSYDNPTSKEFFVMDTIGDVSKFTVNTEEQKIKSLETLVNHKHDHCAYYNSLDVTDANSAELLLLAAKGIEKLSLSGTLPTEPEMINEIVSKENIKIDADHILLVESLKISIFDKKANKATPCYDSPKAKKNSSPMAIEHVAYSTSNSMVAVIHDKGYQILKLNLADKKLEAQHEFIETIDSRSYSSASFSPDGNTLAIMRNDGFISLDVQNEFKMKTRIFAPSTDNPQCLSWHPTNKEKLAIGYKTGRVTICNPFNRSSSNIASVEAQFNCSIIEVTWVGESELMVRSTTQIQIWKI